VTPKGQGRDPNIFVAQYIYMYIYICDMWALRKILRIPYTRHITNDEVRSRSNCQPLCSIVTSRRLRFFSHIARSSPDEDQHRAIAATIRKPPPDWRRLAGRPSHTWLRSVEADLRPLNIDLSSAWRKASGRADWRHVVDMATLWKSTP